MNKWFGCSRMTKRVIVACVTIMICCSQSMDNFVPDIGILTYKWDNLNLEFYRRNKNWHMSTMGRYITKGWKECQILPSQMVLVNIWHLWNKKYVICKRNKILVEVWRLLEIKKYNKVYLLNNSLYPYVHSSIFYIFPKNYDWCYFHQKNIRVVEL